MDLIDAQKPGLVVPTRRTVSLSLHKLKTRRATGGEAAQESIDDLQDSNRRFGKA